MTIVLITFLALALAILAYYHNKMRNDLMRTKKDNGMLKSYLKNSNTDVRSTLNVFLKIADILEENAPNQIEEKRQTIIEQLRYNTGIIRSSLDGVMIFTEADAPGLQLRDEMFSPDVVCRRCVEANRNNIYKDDELQIHFMQTLGDEFLVQSNRHAVELMVNKLVLLACFFTRKGHITVGCNTSENPGKLTIFVSDTGQGIPKHRKRHLYSWFDAPEDIFHDAEVDLSICHRLASKLGGEMRIDPTHTKGTRVLLVLPLK